MSVLDLPSRDIILEQLGSDVDIQAFVYYKVFKNTDVQSFFNFLLIINEYDNKYYWNKYLQYVNEDKSIHIDRFEKVLIKVKKIIDKNEFYNPITEELIVEKDPVEIYSYISSCLNCILIYCNCFDYLTNPKFKEFEKELDFFLDDITDWFSEYESAYSGEVFESEYEKILIFKNFMITKFYTFWKSWVVKVHSLEYSFDLEKEYFQIT